MNRKPTALKELNGSAKNHPERVNKDEPKPTAGIGPYPKDIPTDEEAIWDWLVGITAPGVLTNMDRATMFMLTKLFRKFIVDEISNPELAQLSKLLGSIGHNPTDRGRIGIKPDGRKKSKFEDL